MVCEVEGEKEGSEEARTVRTVIWQAFVLRHSSGEIYSWNRPLAQKAERASFKEKSLVFGHEHDLYDDVSSVLMLIKKKRLAV